MTQVVYADLLFLVNFSMDFLCLFVSARLLHRHSRMWRLLFAAALGGVYSVAVLFISLSGIYSVLLDLFACAVICFFAFGVNNGGAFGYFASTAVFFGVSVGTGGLMTAMYSLLNRMDLPLDSVRENGDGISVWLFGLLAVISGVAASIGGDFFKTVSCDTILSIKIDYKGESVTLNGMTDTGNLLTDPISAKPVIVVDANYISLLVGERCAAAAAHGDISNSAWEKGEHLIRIIPISTASGSSVLCAFVPDKITLTLKSKKGKERVIYPDALFAPSYLNFDIKRKTAGCAALVPPSLIT